MKNLSTLIFLNGVSSQQLPGGGPQKPVYVERLPLLSLNFEQPKSILINAQWAADDETLRQQNEELIREMNILRANPASLIPDLENIKREFVAFPWGMEEYGEVFFAPGSYMNQNGSSYLWTGEGAAVYDELIDFLKNEQQPVQPLVWNAELQQNACEWVEIAVANHFKGHGSEGEPGFAQRQKTSRASSGWTSENISYDTGSYTAKHLIIGWAVDDKVSSRGHRKNLFKADSQTMGLCTGEDVAGDWGEQVQIFGGRWGSGADWEPPVEEPPVEEPPVEEPPVEEPPVVEPPVEEPPVEEPPVVECKPFTRLQENGECAPDTCENDAWIYAENGTCLKQCSGNREPNAKRRGCMLKAQPPVVECDPYTRLQENGECAPDTCDNDAWVYAADGTCLKQCSGNRTPNAKRRGCMLVEQDQPDAEYDGFEERRQGYCISQKKKGKNLSNVGECASLCEGRSNKFSYRADKGQCRCCKGVTEWKNKQTWQTYAFTQ